MKISQLASLVHASLPAQATPVARQILLLQVETREKNHEKWSEEENLLLVCLGRKFRLPREQEW